MTLEGVRARLGHAAVLLDLDGTLAPIVARPEDARVEPEAPEVLGRLVPRVRTLAVITGRPSAFVREQLPVDGLQVEGLYGLESAGRLPHEVKEAVAVVVSTEPQAQLEDKVVTVAAHYRNCADPSGAARRLRSALAPIAERHGLSLLEGKMVYELAPPGGSKGDAVRRLADGAEAVLYAGDDVADLDAFAVLDELRASGVVVAKIAVLGADTPAELREMADRVVPDPVGLLGLLAGLLREPARGGEVPELG